jgi:hypothetical protein
MFWDPDFRALIWQYLSLDRRLPVWMRWLRALCSPVSDFVAPAFQSFRKAKLYDLAHNSQVTYMQAVLNDTFDNTLRRIYIADPAFDDPVYVYQASELKPVYIWQASEVTGAVPNAAAVYVYEASECYTGSGVQFVVNVPAAVYGGLDVHELRGLVDEYRLVSKKNYSIVTF